MMTRQAALRRRLLATSYAFHDAQYGLPKGRFSDLEHRPLYGMANGSIMGRFSDLDIDIRSAALAWHYDAYARLRPRDIWTRTT